MNKGCDTYRFLCYTYINVENYKWKIIYIMVHFIVSVN